MAKTVVMFAYGFCKYQIVKFMENDNDKILPRNQRANKYGKKSPLLHVIKFRLIY